MDYSRAGLGMEGGGGHLFYPFFFNWKDILSLNLYMNILLSHYECYIPLFNMMNVTCRVGPKVW